MHKHEGSHEGVGKAWWYKSAIDVVIGRREFEYTCIIHWYVCSAFRVGNKQEYKDKRGNIMIMPSDVFVT